MARRTLLACMLAMAACGDAGPVSGPGTLTATLITPREAEGSALISVVGEGVGDVRSAGDGWVFSEPAGDTTRVVIVGDASGSLRFLVEVADTTVKPSALVLQVASPDNVLRRGLGRYDVEFRR